MQNEVRTALPADAARIRVDDFHKVTDGSHGEVNSRGTFLLINLEITMKAGRRSPAS